MMDCTPNTDDFVRLTCKRKIVEGEANEGVRLIKRDEGEEFEEEMRASRSSSAETLPGKD